MDLLCAIQCSKGCGGDTDNELTHTSDIVLNVLHIFVVFKKEVIITVCIGSTSEMLSNYTYICLYYNQISYFPKEF